jgi:phenylacetic acid degradation operon negative regulatory protein
MRSVLRKRDEDTRHPIVRRGRGGTMVLAMSALADQSSHRPNLDALLAGERPLTARSVIASALLGTDPPEMPVRRLVQTSSLYGIAEGAVRTALWRMVADGELAADDGQYRIAGRLLERRHRIEDSQAAYRRVWGGTWELAVVAAERRPAPERAELRTAAVALHLREIREGVWARPDNLDPDRLPAQQAVVDTQCVRFTGAAAPGGLAEQLFDLDGWARRAEALEAAMDEDDTRHEPLARGGLAAGFTLSAAVVRHLQADPLLPDELLPPNWPGDRLRRRYERHDESYKQRLGRWLRHSE